MVGSQKAIVAILTNKDKYKICDMAYQIKKLCIFFLFHGCPVLSQGFMSRIFSTFALAEIGAVKPGLFLKFHR